nr:ATP-binding protein [Sphingomonas oleivorans]
MRDPLRLGGSVIAATLAAGLSWALAAPRGAVLLTALIAAAGTWFAIRNNNHTPLAAEPPPPPPGPDEATLALVEAIDDPILLVERQVIVRANAAARALFGAHVEGEDVRLAIRHPAAVGHLAGRQHEPVELVGIGERDRRWELTARDIGQGRRLVRLRDRTASHATEKMRVDFVANASHELRTPLATLLGFIETLEDANGPKDGPIRARFLKIMFGEAKRMQQLIDDLMSLSRIEADKYNLPQTAVELAPLVEEVSMALRAGLPDGEDRILVRTDADVPAVTGDRVQLSQLLHNIIGNALKYGRAGTPVRITLSKARGGMARISVADEGEGIAPEHLPRLTERFYRVDPGRSRSVGGTGLGLAIVKHIVERHRGRLDIDSVVGRGTTVRVLLPPAREPVIKP